MIRRSPRSTLFPYTSSSDLKVTASGATGQFDTTGLAPGHYTVNCHADDGKGGKADGSTDIEVQDRKSTRLNSSHSQISYAVFCLKKKKKEQLVNITSMQYS